MNKSGNFNSTKKENANRGDLFEAQLNRAKGFLGDNTELDNKALRLAATDVFVEEAQYHLTFRGFFSYIFAGFFLAGTAFVAYLFLLWLAGEFHLGIESVDPVVEIATGPLILMILERLAVTTVFLSGIYFNATFARAFLHEGTILFSRRHALRFGRLYIYLSDGKIVSEDLFEAFGWNITPTTAFAKVNTELFTKGLVGQLGDALQKTAKSAAHLSGKRN